MSARRRTVGGAAGKSPRGESTAPRGAGAAKGGKRQARAGAQGESPRRQQPRPDARPAKATRGDAGAGKAAPAQQQRRPKAQEAQQPAAQQRAAQPQRAARDPQPAERDPQRAERGAQRAARDPQRAEQQQRAERDAQRAERDARRAERERRRQEALAAEEAEQARARERAQRVGAIVVARGGNAGGKRKQKFRRLLDRVDRLKQELRGWHDARPQIDARISAFTSAQERHARLRHELAVLMDRMHGDPALDDLDRPALSFVIAELAGGLLRDGGHDDLKPIYNRHSRRDFDREAAAAEAEQLADARGMLEVMGVEFGDADVSSLDKLQAFAEEQMRMHEQDAAARADARAHRKKPAPQVAAEERRQEERHRAGKALQAVYRALAMALHPDREQDPAERDRKAALMSEVNVAYEAQDLLRLLEIQLELERVDAASPDRAETSAEDRLEPYNRLLEEQARHLEDQIDAIDLPFRIELEIPPPDPITPADVLEALGEDLAAVEAQNQAITRDLAAFQDPRQLQAWIRARTGRRPGSPRPTGRRTRRDRDRDEQLDLFR